MLGYPYTTPIVLTDSIFSQYGGHINIPNNAQRQAAYLIAERAVSEELDTYLTPTIVTGTYFFGAVQKYNLLDNSYVNRVIITRFIDTKEVIYWTATGTSNGYVSVRNGDYGMIDINYLLTSCNCSSYGEYPYKIQVVYEAGFSSGVAYNPDILLALTTMADIVLNEIIGYGNEAPGDIGVKSYNNQEYSEQRVGLLRTTFGTSARANFAAKLLAKYKRRKYVGMI